MRKLVIAAVLSAVLGFGQGNGKKDRGPMPGPLDQPGVSHPEPLPPATPQPMGPGARQPEGKQSKRSHSGNGKQKKQTQKGTRPQKSN